MTTTIEHMTETQVRREALRLLHENHLWGWKITFGSAAGRAGSCHHAKKTLRFSRVLMAARPAEDTLDIVRHEVAHALAGLKEGHGEEWKAIFRRLGGSGDRCWNTSTIVKPENVYRWAHLCGGCKNVLGQSARKRNYDRYETRCCRARVISTPINQEIYPRQALTRYTAHA